MDITQYIEQTKNMQESGIVGSSSCFDFGDMVLIKYKGVPGHLPRKNEEYVAEKINSLRDAGVRSPYHYAIKRETIDNVPICWVLQEKAKGDIFNKYSFIEGHNDLSEQLRMQQILIDAPDAHYEKLVYDLMQLFNLGLELKPKNIFYDANIENGGFTIIDLLGNDGPEFDSSLESILRLIELSRFVSSKTTIYQMSDDIDPNLLKFSEELSKEISLKTFKALEKVVPNFSELRRWILRSYPTSLLEYFENRGVPVGDLSLTQEEQKSFDDMIQNILDHSFELIESGEMEYWQIEMNLIHNDIQNIGLQYSWKYHPNNPSISDKNKDLDYTNPSEICAIIKNIFCDKLEKKAYEKNASPYIKEAYKEYLQRTNQIEKMIAFKHMG